MYYCKCYIRIQSVSHYTAREDALRLRGLMETDTKRNAAKRKATDPDGTHDMAMRKADIRGMNSFKFVS
jgi:hypothetical protein